MNNVLLVLAFISFFLMGIKAVDLTEYQIWQLCDGKYLDIIGYPGEPSKFIVCLNGNSQIGICRLDNTVQTCFNERKQTCSLDFCPPNDQPSDFIKDYCKNDANLFHKMPGKSCENFYICMGSVTSPIRENCPDGQHFSNMNKTCMSPMEANCQTLDSMCTDKTAGYRFAGPNCYDYYECSNSRPISKSCSYGEHFDSVAKKCIPEENSICIDKTNRIPTCTSTNNGQYFKHSRCSRFYVCMNNVAYTGRCPQNYYFDVRAQLCKKDTNDVCSD